MIPSWTAQKNDRKNDIESINQSSQQSTDRLNQLTNLTNNQPIKTNRPSDWERRLGKAGDFGKSQNQLRSNWSNNYDHH